MPAPCRSPGPGGGGQAVRAGQRALSERPVCRGHQGLYRGPPPRPSPLGLVQHRPLPREPGRPHQRPVLFQAGPGADHRGHGPRRYPTAHPTIEGPAGEGLCEHQTLGGRRDRGRARGAGEGPNPHRGAAHPGGARVDPGPGRPPPGGEAGQGGDGQGAARGGAPGAAGQTLPDPAPPLPQVQDLPLAEAGRCGEPALADQPPWRIRPHLQPAHGRRPWRTGLPHLQERLRGLTLHLLSRGTGVHQSHQDSHQQR